MPIRIYSPGIPSLKLTQQRQPFVPTSQYNHSQLAYSENLNKDDVKSKERAIADHKREVSVSGQRADHFKPYRPLGNMQSLLHLKVVLVKVNPHTGERSLKVIGKRAKEEEEEEEDEDTVVDMEENEKHPDKEAGQKDEDPSNRSSSQSRSLNRVLTLKRSDAYNKISKRAVTAKKLSKSIAAGSFIYSHFTPRTASECVDFAIKHVKSCPHPSDIEQSIFSVLHKYDYGSSGFQPMDRSTSHGSLMSMGEGSRVGTNSAVGSSSATSTVFTTQMNTSSSVAHPPIGRARAAGSFTVSQKLNTMLTSNGVAKDSSERPDDESVATGTVRSIPRRPLAKKKIAGGVFAGRNQFLKDAQPRSGGTSRSNSQMPTQNVLNLHQLVHHDSFKKHLKATVDPKRQVDNLFKTVQGIFYERAASGHELERQLEEADFNWPQVMLDRSKAFMESEGEEVRSRMLRFRNVIAEYKVMLEESRKRTETGEIGERKKMQSVFESEDDAMSEVSILLSPRKFKTWTAELASNKEKAESRRLQQIGSYIHNSLWWIETCRHTRDSLKGKAAPLFVLEFLAAVRQLIIFGFEFEKDTMYTLMSKVMRPDHHKNHVAQHMIRRLRAHVGMGPEEYLVWLKGKDIQPPAGLIREVKQQGVKGKNASGRRGVGRRRKKKPGHTSSLATLGELDDGIQDDDDTGSNFGSTADLLSLRSPKEGGGKLAMGMSFGDNILEEGDEGSEAASDVSAMSKTLSKYGIKEERSIVTMNAIKSSEAGNRRGSHSGTIAAVLSPRGASSRRGSVTYT